MADHLDIPSQRGADNADRIELDEEVEQDLAMERLLHTRLRPRPQSVLQLDPETEEYLRSQLGRTDEQ